MAKRNRAKQREHAKEKAKKENEIKMQEAVESDQCPVCFEPFEGNGPPYDDSIGCENKHSFCVPCVRELVRPRLHAKFGEEAFQFTCPICREEAKLTEEHVMVLLKGSWKRYVENMKDELIRSMA